MTKQACDHAYSLDGSAEGLCMFCNEYASQVTCPECDEPCTPEELAQWEMCHDCDNSKCEECGFWEGHEQGCAIGLMEYLDNPF